MFDPHTYLESGILEEYSLGLTTQVQNHVVEALCDQFPEIQIALKAMQESLHAYAATGTVAKSPSPGLKSQLLERIAQLEPDPFTIDLNHPPLIDRHAPLDAWLTATAHLHPPTDFQGIHMIPIRKEEEVEQFVAWADHLVPEEIHTDTVESFIVLKGTCTCHIGTDTIIDLVPGGFLPIPLNLTHQVRVTSEEPLMAVLQKIAV